MNRMLLFGNALLLSLALLLAPGVAAAEDEGAGRDDLKAKIKKKMEEILELMAENERALLELSTGADGKPRRVDVEVPDVPPAKGASGTGSDGSSGSSGGATKSGEEIARRLRELIEGQRGRGQRIPKEMEELLRMIPRSQGKGQGQPQGKPSDGKQKDQASEELREARRKRLEEQKRREETKRQRGDPSNPAESDRMRTGKPEDKEKPEDASRGPDVPVWFTALPPEIRDALAGGQAEKIPQKYRHLIARYNLYIQKQAAKTGR